ncbi:S8 family peptidase [Clostridium botulinum]|uniref:Peptidase S8 n=1 Tax=Clostridium botulinum TaxID=1491 RepID=A0A6B4JQL6_CLOBO|nr:S8 family peptidase [Clostridium botulinum]EES48476.1 peptidase, family S8 and S53 [Clostridium botulinum E1 str. 'BoNT E Beluga']MBY6761673.1 S8 family peptidase [Clostridium botulinum]MBY6921673.1 S8 family peptidase [Clostridium botulinum]MCR1132648.1 S8 family peptidase [Clostridium botulinum]NFH69874.1 peptidase S8 [Clostridium botulinum]
MSENIFNSINYRDYLVQYQGKMIGKLNNIDGVLIKPINDELAILTIRKNLQNNINDFSVLEKDLNKDKASLSSIIYIKSPELYTLEDISPLEEAQISSVQQNNPLNLLGDNIVVGIIDTGIDYLNEEFITDDNKTRINFIWDQSLDIFEDINGELKYGEIYKKDDINKAIELYKQGGNPYDIVKTKDEIGHGTAMAGIIAARGKNPELRGVAPKCELCVIKLTEAVSYKEDFEIEVPVYNVTSIVIAIETLYKYAIEYKKPLVIYLPLGTNSGNHQGTGLLNEYIENVTNNRGIIVVTGAGNEGDVGHHASGIIEKKDMVDDIELYVAEGQKVLITDIWIDMPNIMSVNVISPSGEETGVLVPLLKKENKYKFIFENTVVDIRYYIPEETTGDEYIQIYLYDIEPGLWTFRIIGNIISSGIFNIWIPQKGITKPGTGFRAPDPYGTLTIPGDSTSVVTVAAYNQNTNNALIYSSMTFKNSEVSIIDLAAGGVNAITTASNNSITTVSGTSVSAAVVAGVCALLLEWGIVDGNYPYMYCQSLISYLVKGTDRRKGDIYPNAQWGYGTLNVLKMFENMT